MFLTLDGVDHSGKTTQLALVAAWLREQGHDVVTCRDPGSTRLGDAVRDLLLHRTEIEFAMRAEMFLYMAARAQLVDEVIRPALAAGKLVVSDRYLLANVVYQGYAGGLPVGELRRVGRVATSGVKPDLSIVLDLDPAVAAARRAGAADRLEQRGPDYHAAVRAGFLAEAARRRRRIVVVDAARDIETVQAEIRTIVSSRLLNRG